MVKIFILAGRTKFQLLSYGILKLFSSQFAYSSSSPISLLLPVCDTLLHTLCFFSNTLISLTPSTFFSISLDTKQPFPGLFLQSCRLARSSGTGCSSSIVFFRQFQNIFRTLASLGFCSVCSPDFMLGPLDGR